MEIKKIRCDYKNCIREMLPKDAVSFAMVTGSEFNGVETEKKVEGIDLCPSCAGRLLRLYFKKEEEGVKFSKYLKENGVTPPAWGEGTV